MQGNRFSGKAVPEVQRGDIRMVVADNMFGVTEFGFLAADQLDDHRRRLGERGDEMAADVELVAVFPQNCP